MPCPSAGRCWDTSFTYPGCTWERRPKEGKEHPESDHSYLRFLLTSWPLWPGMKWGWEQCYTNFISRTDPKKAPMFFISQNKMLMGKFPPFSLQYEKTKKVRRMEISSITLQPKPFRPVGCIAFAVISEDTSLASGCSWTCFWPVWHLIIVWRKRTKNLESFLIALTLNWG